MFTNIPDKQQYTTNVYKYTQLTAVHYQCLQIHPINCSTLPMFTNISNKQQYTTNVYKYTWETAVHYQCLQIYPINSSTLPMFTNIPDKLEYTITVKKIPDELQYTTKWVLSPFVFSQNFPFRDTTRQKLPNCWHII